MRRRKNFIPCLRDADELTFSRDRKHLLLADYFQQVIGTAMPGSHTVNLQALDWQVVDLSDLEAPFTEEEVWEVIRT